jgi:hypothetical protein
MVDKGEGIYTFKVRALRSRGSVSENDSEWSEFSIGLDTKTLTKLSTPISKWTGTTASWEAVNGATAYIYEVIYPHAHRANSRGPNKISKLSLDISNCIEVSGIYRFRVMAIGYNAISGWTFIEYDTNNPQPLPKLPMYEKHPEIPDFGAITKSKLLNETSDYGQYIYVYEVLENDAPILLDKYSKSLSDTDDSGFNISDISSNGLIYRKNDIFVRPEYHASQNILIQTEVCALIGMP